MTRPARIPIACAHCNTVLMRTPSQIHRRARSFCNVNCFDAGRRVVGAKWRDKEHIKRYQAAYRHRRKQK